MAKQSENDRYENLLAALDRTALDPLEWNNVAEELAALVGATGGLFVPYDEEERGFAQPHSASMDEVFQEYVESGWHRRDFRARGPPVSLADEAAFRQELEWALDKIEMVR